MDITTSFVTLVLVCSLWFSRCSAGPQELLKKLMRTYERTQPPETDKATTVYFGMYVNNIQVDSGRKVMRLDAFLRYAWQDKRLALPTGQAILRLFPHESKLLWIPDLFIRNRDYVVSNDAMDPGVLCLVNATGHVWYVRRFTIGVWCPGLSTVFGQTQLCSIFVESFGYKTDTLLIKPMGQAVGINTQGIRTRHSLTSVDWRDCSQAGGSVPCLRFNFKFKPSI